MINKFNYVKDIKVEAQNILLIFRKPSYGKYGYNQKLLQ